LKPIYGLDLGACPRKNVI